MATGYSPRTIYPFGINGHQGTAAQQDWSPWFFVGIYVSTSINVQGLESGGVVEVAVSNLGQLDGPPADNDHGSPHSTLGNITADTAASLGAGFNWVRVAKTPGGTPATTKINIVGMVPK